MSGLTARLAFGLVIAVATTLRAIHLAWGLPSFDHPDSLIYFVQPAAQLVAARQLVPPQFVHPPGLVYALGLVYLLWSTLSSHAIILTNPGFTAELPTLVLVGRAVCSGIGVASVAVLYLLARRLAGTRAALLAAAAFAVAPLHVLESHRVNPDGAAILLMLLAAHAAVRAADERGTGRLLAGFALAGLAGATKYTGLLGATVPAGIALAWEGAARPRRLGLVLVGACVTVAVFSVGMLPAAFAWSRVVDALHMMSAFGYTILPPGQGLSGDGWVFRRYLYPLLVSLPYIMGWPAYLLALTGLVAIGRTSRRAQAVVLAAIVPYFLLQGSAPLAVHRYFLPLLPWLALAAGAALDRVWRARRAFGAVLAACVVGYTALLSVSQCARLRLAPRDAVARMIAERAPAGDAVDRPLVVGYQDAVTLVYDPLRPRLLQPGVRVVYFPEPDQNLRQVAARVPSDDERLALERQWVRDTGVEVVVLPDWVENGVLRERPDGPIAGFYRRLADGRLGFRLAADFRSHYLTEALYVWADPMLETHLETGILAYKVFLRDGEAG